MPFSELHVYGQDIVPACHIRPLVTIAEGNAELAILPILQRAEALARKSTCLSRQVSSREKKH